MLGGGASGRCSGHEGLVSLQKRTPPSSLAPDTMRTGGQHVSENPEESPHQNAAMRPDLRLAASGAVRSTLPPHHAPVRRPHSLRQGLCFLHDSFTETQFTRHRTGHVSTFTVVQQSLQPDFRTCRPPKGSPEPSNSQPQAPPDLLPSRKQALIYVPSLQICLFWTFHINGIT